MDDANFFQEVFRENLLHFTARHNLKNLCSILITLPGSYESLKSLNLESELPCQLATRKKHKEIARLM